MKKYIIYSFLITLLFFSCNDDSFLDETPKGVVIPETVEDYDLMLNNLQDLIGNNLPYLDPDNGAAHAGISFLGQLALNVFEWKDFLYTQEQDDGDWNNAYQSIFVANEILANIDDAPGSSESLRAFVKGDALTERAAVYFLLVNLYAKHYNAASASTDLGVPIVLKADVFQEPQARATVQEVYDQIIADLMAAKDLVRTVRPREAKRGSLAAVNGLLAKVYLYMSDFEKAQSYADDSFTDHGQLINFNDFTLPDPADSSTFPDHPYAGIENDGAYLNNEEIVLHRNTTRFIFGIAGYSAGLEALYTDKINDLRWRHYSDVSFFGSYFAYGGINSFALNGDRRYDRTILVSTPETLLIRAEAKARNQDKDGAIADLNLLRAKRFTTGTGQLDPMDYATDEEALQEVLNERRRELAFTGLNWFDLKRYHTEGRTIPTFTRDAAGTIVTLEPGSNRYVMAIPPKVVLLNPNLEQNDR
ncbi:RagB/SusD family nutrient uptake outer membrane protein [Maribacter sp. 2304DJ31-5]|uniref:RagB/SusD family nutrient uptake outer membrane protein n=1 Tax=Maribacter sp. 2304DJ31-5 TaxID=3386273 RepID=UPI0039BCD854